MSSAKTDAARQGRTRVPSIARSINWGFWWRRIVGWLFLDALLAIALVAVFIFSCQQTLPEGVVGPNLMPSPGSYASFGGDSLDFTQWSYKLVSGGKTYEFPFIDYLRTMVPFIAVLLSWEVIDVLGFVMSTRRVRRQLQPLQDLALKAEAMGNAALADPMAAGAKMATLEQAIERASVDSPTVATGDQELRSIEVALNGLLHQMQEAKLQQMRFVSDASHELRTPIAVIQGYVNMLDRWGKTDEKVLEESIESLKAESDHMQELVEQLLFLARGDSGRNTLQKTRLNLAALMREVWEESCMIDSDHVYQCRASEQQAASDAFALVGDLAMLKQSMRIIIQNAQKYSASGSTITLDVDSDQDSVSYSVLDEGIGMSQQDAAHVFERFYRADGARAEDAQAIEVTSREGVGTRFTVRIPKRIPSV